MGSKILHVDMNFGARDLGSALALDVMMHLEIVNIKKDDYELFFKNYKGDFFRDFFDYVSFIESALIYEYNMRFNDSFETDFEYELPCNDFERMLAKKILDDFAEKYCNSFYRIDNSKELKKSEREHLIYYSFLFVTYSIMENFIWPPYRLR